MDQHGKNKLKMYKAVQTVCASHQADWNGLPAFATAFAQFTTRLDALEQASYEQSVATVGVMAGKEQLLDETIEQANVVAKALKAYASATHDTQLAEQANIPKHFYRRGGGRQVLNLVDRVVNLATTVIQHLGDYGIVQTDLDDLVAQRQQLDTAIGTPRAAIIDRRTQTQAIEQLGEEIDKLLRDQLDSLVEVLKNNTVAFWTKYRNARVVVDNKGKTHEPHGLGESPDGEGPGMPPPNHGAGGIAGG